MKRLILAFFMVPSLVFAGTYTSEYPNVMNHMTIKPKEEYVQPEPQVEVQRYDANQFRNDPTVLISAPNKSKSAIDLNDIPLEIVKTKKVSHFRNKPVIVKATWCDDAKEVC